jgi:hypothetical protein
MLKGHLQVKHTLFVSRLLVLFAPLEMLADRPESCIDHSSSERSCWQPAQQRDTDDLDVIPRLFRLLVDLGPFDEPDRVHATNHGAKHGVLVVKPWRGHGGDEELRPA